MNTIKLKDILMMSEPELQVFLKEKLIDLEYDINCGKDENEKILYLYSIQSSSLPVLLIAHTDIAHDYPPKEIYYDDLDGVLISPTGLGADDRAGIFAILELIKRHKCDVLFTAGEEKGLTGAKQFIKDHEANTKYHMLIELDNPGYNGAMFYDNDSQEFQNYIMEFGYVITDGKATDIKVIAPQWRVNAVNLSIGYYNAHKKYEHLNLDQLEDAMSKVSNILSQPIPNFEYKVMDL